MNAIIALLVRLRIIDGKTLDKAIKKMLAADSYLEGVEASEAAKVEKATAKIAKHETAKATAAENVARAGRIRSRVKDFVA
ncbi:hypothetical protein [Mesorhizobium sp. M8A.F.Ca.ET.021.01.1.1]|uniref:hypothetical protein n=1 Tax=Mesorhizobium sp. M8A.F.Ca.ET.021.01.1.1 TaxID=2496757 RepID=UPI001679C744|nr:hypothetical protein [Mesorhizobium sp. M8A.F.Ca.ET.021.01.1.1]